jgi:serine/threonine-protein kinase
MAYQSDESGRFEVHVRPFPDVDTGHWVVSAQGGQAPRWAPTGRTLYYRSGRRIMMVPVETTPQFRAGQARSHLNNPLTLLNDPRLSLLIPDRTYDVAANGTRLLILEDAGGSNDTSARPGIAVVQHWVEQLRDVAAPRK